MTGAARIGIFVHTLDDRAVSRLNLKLAQELIRHGRWVAIICAVRRLSADVPPNIVVHDLGLGDKKTSRGVGRLVRLLRDQRFDVVFSHGNGPNRALVVSRSIARVPTKIVLVEHQHYSTAGWDRRRLRDLAVRFLYPRADLVAGPAPGVIDDLERVAPAIRGRTAVLVSPGIDPGTAGRGYAADADHLWLTPRRAHKVIVSVANVIPRKGQDVIIEALPRIRSAVGDVRLVLVGRHDNPGYLERLRRMIDERHLADVVDLPGYRPDPLPLMAAADVFVLASRNEGMGMVLVEAMACGTPVIATDCPSGPEFLIGSDKGILVPVDDADALADAAAAVLGDEALRQRLVGSGLSRASGFTPAAVAADYLGVADRLTEAALT